MEHLAWYCNFSGVDYVKDETYELELVPFIWLKWTDLLISQITGNKSKWDLGE